MAPKRAHFLLTPPPSTHDHETTATEQQLKEIELQLLGERIRRARLEQKITQRAFCLNLFSSAYLSSVELGKTRPTLSTLQLIALRLKKPLGYFLRPVPSTGEWSEEWQQQESQLVRFRQGLIRVRAALSSGEMEVASLLLEQFKPDLSRMPEAEQASFHIWQATLYNNQRAYEKALTELDTTTKLIKSQSQGQVYPLPPDIAARQALEYGRAYFNCHRYIDALNNFLAGLNQTELTDGYLLRRLKLLTIQCYVALEKPREAGELLDSLTGSHQPDQMIELAHSYYQFTKIPDFQQGLFFFAYSAQLWSQISDTSLKAKFYLDYTRTLFQLRHYETALQTALNVYKIIGDSASCHSLEILSLLALLYNRLSEPAKAQDWLDKAKTFMEMQPSKAGIATIRFYQAAGEIAAKQERGEEAIGFYHKAVQQLEEKGPDEGLELNNLRQDLLAEIYFLLAQLLRKLNRHQEALVYIEKAYLLR